VFSLAVRWGNRSTKFSTYHQSLIEKLHLGLMHNPHLRQTNVVRSVFMERFDINKRKLKNGDVIDLHQTVNGQNLFVVFTIEPLDIRYAHNVTRKYEYDKEEMLAPSRFTNEVEWEIVNNLYSQMLGLAF
jgi:hypothetical protein